MARYSWQQENDFDAMTMHLFFLKKIENQWINKASQEKKMPDCYSKDSKKRKGGNPSFIHIIPTFNHMLS